jgi:hypothetical protein
VSVQEIFQNYQHKGLQVLWVVGEDEEKQIPSLDWIANWKAKEGATFTVVRDANFFQVYGAVNPHSNALPHQYILDASNMELIFATGGVDPAAEELIFNTLDAPTSSEEESETGDEASQSGDEASQSGDEGSQSSVP